MRRPVSFLVAVMTFAAVGVIGARVRPAHADGLPSITVGSASVIEGDAGSAIVKVPIDLSAPSSVPVTVSYVVKSGTAMGGSDFYATKGKVSFLVGGAVSKVVSVKVYGDTTPESDETVRVDVSSPVNATLANTEGLVTIVDDDSDANTGLQVSVGDLTVEEANAGTHYAYLPVTLSRPAPSTVKVYYAISCSSAVEGVDYQTTNTGTLTFLVRQQIKQLRFVIDANTTVEDARSILDTIKVTKGPAVVNQAQGETTIIDNDGSASGLPSLPVLGVERESVSSQGIGGQSPDPGVCSSHAFGSFGASISADGRYVAFISDAVNLVPNDNNGEWDAFVRDRVTGTTERVSVASDGSETAPNGPSGAPYPGADSAAISRDGRDVTFYEYRSIGAYPGNQYFIHDRQTGTTVPLLKDLSGNPVSSGASWSMGLSNNERYVVFQLCGDASGTLVPSDLDPGTGNATCDVFRYDRTTNTSVLVSQPPDNSPSDGFAPSMSADGRYVAFWSTNPSYVSGDTNGCEDAFVRDMDTGTFHRVNVTSTGDQELAPNDGECDPWPRPMSLSDDGRYVAFDASGWNLVGLSAPSPSWVESGIHTFVRDTVGQTTKMVDAGGQIFTGSPAISGDGSYVAYSCSWCSDDSIEIVTNVATGETIRASELPDGTQGDLSDYSSEQSTQALSGDGTYLAFSSGATNLDANDDNDVPDVFLKRVH